MNKLLPIHIIIGLTTLLAGCASTGALVEIRESRLPAGTYYEVKGGDTLWKISKLYDVDVQELVKVNRLPDATKISVGQKLFIPSVADEMDYSKIPDRGDSASTFSWPVRGRVVSYFGSKKGLVTNKGIDIEAKEGGDVVAADSGVVSFADENMKGLGKTIIIDHENGFSTVYAHNSEILVKIGQRVRRNQQIARVGKTGRVSQPYLHFQIRKGHKPQNPFYYLP